MFDLYSMESDNDDIDINVQNNPTIINETAVDDAGKDSKVVEEGNISKEKSAHNEEASAGGVSTGENQDDLEMDPVAATEQYIRKTFGLSREDVEEAVIETVQDADQIPNADVVEEGSADSELEEVGGTTVNINSPSDAHIDVNAASDDVSVGSDSELETTPEVPTIETSSDIATLEGLRRIWSREDDEMDPDGAESSDVEFDVKTPSNDVNIALEDKAVTIEPNDAGGDMGGEPTNEPPAEPEPPADNGGEGGDDTGADAGGEPAADGTAAPEGDDTTTESWNLWV